MRVYDPLAAGTSWFAAAKLLLTAASDVLEECDPGTYTPLDLSGVTIVQCEGDGGILRYGKFFRALGKKTYAFYDKQANAEIAGDIDELHRNCGRQYTGAQRSGAYWRRSNRRA